MEELLAAAAAAMKAPEGLVERSARARAKAQGVPVSDVVRAWAGGGVIAASAAREPAANAAEEPDVSDPSESPPQPAAAAEEPAAPAEEPAAAVAASEPGPQQEPEPGLVASGLLPRWLVAVSYLSAITLMIGGDSSMWLTLAFPVWVLIVSVLFLIRAGAFENHDR